MSRVKTKGSTSLQSSGVKLPSLWGGTRRVALAAIMTAALILPWGQGRAQDVVSCVLGQELELGEGVDVLVEHYSRCLEAPGLTRTERARYHHKRGQVYAAGGRFGLAIDDFDRALRVDPGLAAIHIDRGTALAGMGELNRALGSYDKAIRIDPSAATAYNKRGEIYYAQGHLEQALRDYEKALAFNPDSVEAHNNRGIALADQGKLARAIKDYETALSLDPNFAVAYYNRGNAYSEQGDLERAVEDYDAALRLNPGDAGVYHNRGVALFEHGHHADAIADFRHALTFAPDNIYSAIWLYLAQARAGEEERAELRRNAERLRLDMADWPGPVIGMFLGDVDVQVVTDMGKPNATHADKERRCEAWFYVGQHELLAGRQDSARTLFKAVLRTGITNFFEFSAARAELRRMAGG